MVPKFCFNLIVQNFMCISCFIPELVESAELNPPSVGKMVHTLSQFKYLLPCTMVCKVDLKEMSLFKNSAIKHTLIDGLALSQKR